MNNTENKYKVIQENFKNFLNEEFDGENEPGGNIREILPQMVRISNNSRITQATAHAIADKLSKEEFRDFRVWLKLIEQNK